MAVGAGVSLLGRALGHIGKLKSVAPRLKTAWTGLTHGLRPAANNTVTALATVPKVAPAVPKMTRGVLHPLSILATGTKVAIPAVTVGTGVQMLSNLGDWTNASNVGVDKTGDLDSVGQTFDEGYNAIDRLRLSLGALGKGQFAEAIMGPSDKTKQDVMDAARKQRADDIRSTFSRELLTNAQSLGGLNPLVSRNHNFVGRDIESIRAGIESDAVRGGKVQQLLGIEGGIEKLAELDPNVTSSALTGAATQLNVTNRNKAEQKAKDELERQEKRIDDANRIERERQDANQRLQLLINDNALARQDRETTAAREERNYMTMLDLKEKRAARRDQRIRDEKQSQREMISIILGGLNNAFD